MALCFVFFIFSPCSPAINNGNFWHLLSVCFLSAACLQFVKLRGYLRCPCCSIHCRKLSPTQSCGSHTAVPRMFQQGWTTFIYKCSSVFLYGATSHLKKQQVQIRSKLNKFYWGQEPSSWAQNRARLSVLGVVRLHVAVSSCQRTTAPQHFPLPFF